MGGHRSAESKSQIRLDPLINAARRLLGTMAPVEPRLTFTRIVPTVTKVALAKHAWFVWEINSPAGLKSIIIAIVPG